VNRATKKIQIDRAGPTTGTHPSLSPSAILCWPRASDSSASLGSYCGAALVRASFMELLRSRLSSEDAERIGTTTALPRLEGGGAVVLRVETAHMLRNFELVLWEWGQWASDDDEGFSVQLPRGVAAQDDPAQGIANGTLSLQKYVVKHPYRWYLTGNAGWPDDVPNETTQKRHNINIPQFRGQDTRAHRRPDCHPRSTEAESQGERIFTHDES
jgi:hypothetical protein